MVSSYRINFNVSTYTMRLLKVYVANKYTINCVFTGNFLMLIFYLITCSHVKQPLFEYLLVADHSKPAE